VKAGVLIAIAFVGGLVCAPTAGATNVAAVLYKPPKIAVVDQPEQATLENVVVTKDGHEYSFANPGGLVKHPNSNPGCTDDFATDYRCPTAGIAAIALKLGELDDSASIDLGGRADRVNQVLKGGLGEDTLTGGPGKQKLSGNDDNDTITGGPGDDVIDGGPGTDDCVGGPGHDTITNCE
jgi:hypothetical protein